MKATIQSIDYFQNWNGSSCYWRLQEIHICRQLFSAMYGRHLRKAVWIRIKRWDGHWAKEETHMLEISQVD